MFKSTVSRRGIARTLSTLLTLTLTMGVGGLAANGAVAAAVPETPQNVTAQATIADDDTGTVVVNWDAPADPDSISRVDVDLEGQDQRRVPDRRSGVTFSGILPGTYTASVAFEYTDSSPTSDPVTVDVTVPSGPPAPGIPSHLRAGHLKEGGRTTIKWHAPTVGGPVEIYFLYVDGRITFVPGSRTKMKVKGLRAGPAKVKLVGLNGGGYSKTVRIKIHVAKRVAQAPKETLQLGMKGPAVKRLQTNLGMRHPSGTFGKSTRHTVRQYQRYTGATRTGVCNDRMRYLLDV